MQNTRRAFLASTAAAAATIGGLSSSVAAADDYEVIEADNSRYFLSDGETFSNKLIDFSNGNWFQLHTSGASDWEIKNVAFRGQHAHDQSAIIVANDGYGLIENVYMADGCIRPDNPASHGQVGIFVHREHTGHVDIRHCNIQGWPNNGVYGNPPHYADGGSVRIEKCLAANNYVSNFRIGSQGSEIVDSVAYNDGDDYNGRCVWAWGSEVSVENSRFAEGEYPSAIFVKDSTTLNLSGTTYTSLSAGSGTTVNEQGGNRQTSNPDLTPPDGVPMTVEEAVSAGGSSGGGSDPGGSEDDTTGDGSDESDGTDEDTDNDETDGDDGDDGTDDEFVYAVEAHEEGVTYFLEAKEGADFTTDVESDAVYVSDDGTRVAGRLEAGERHAFTGQHVEATTMIDVTIRGDGTGYIDGNESSLGWYPRPEASGDEWKDIDALLGNESEAPDDTDQSGDGEGENEGSNGDSDESANEWDDVFGEDAWWSNNPEGAWIEDFLRALFSQ